MKVRPFVIEDNLSMSYCPSNTTTSHITTIAITNHHHQQPPLYSEFRNRFSRKKTKKRQLLMYMILSLLFSCHKAFYLFIYTFQQNLAMVMKMKAELIAQQKAAG